MLAVLLYKITQHIQGISADCLNNRMEIVTSRRISISPLKSFNIH